MKSPWLQTDPRLCKEFPGSRKWPWMLSFQDSITPGPCAAPSLPPRSPAHPQRQWGNTRESTAWPPAQFRALLYRPGTTTQWSPTQPASPSTVPLPGEMLWVASLKAQAPNCSPTPPHPRLRHKPGKDPRENPSRWPEVPSIPQTHVVPGQAVCVDAVNTTVCKNRSTKPQD